MPLDENAGIADPQNPNSRSHRSVSINPKMVAKYYEGAENEEVMKLRIATTEQLSDGNDKDLIDRALVYMLLVMGTGRSVLDVAAGFGRWAS